MISILSSPSEGSQYRRKIHHFVVAEKGFFIAARWKPLCSRLLRGIGITVLPRTTPPFFNTSAMSRQRLRKSSCNDLFSCAK